MKYYPIELACIYRLLLLCLRQVYLWWFYFTIGCLAGTICLVVTCEGRIYPCLLILFPSQNPRSPRTSPLGLTSLKRKNHPIVVTMGGIGSCYASLTFKPQAFILSTNCVITGTMDWCNTLFPPVCKNNYIGQELWQTQKCECVM
jgi:hypothetical protein